MKFIQFYSMSTGYVEGTAPPEYRDDLKRPQRALGSDGILILDGRYNFASCKRIAENEMLSPKRHRYVGYWLMRGKNISDAAPWGNYEPRKD